MKEELYWILDKKGLDKSNMDNYRGEIFDEQCRQIKDFVHSLNKKCDRVGWSTLDLNEPNSEKILRKINTFCLENGWEARGHYTRTFPDLKSDWYAFQLPYCDALYFEDDEEQEGIPKIAAYKIKKGGPFRAFDNFLVSDKFRSVCQKYKIPGIDFYWAHDKGKYNAKPWFYMIVKPYVLHAAIGRDLSYTESPYAIRHREHLPGSDLYSLYEIHGGYLPILSKMFCELNVILPKHYPSKELPPQGFVYSYMHKDYLYLLVHKETASLLINERAVKQDDIYPVPLYKEPPDGYTIDTTQALKPPSDEYIIKMRSKLEEFRKKIRPEQNFSEKEALKAFRKAKSERKEEFSKGMSCANSNLLQNTNYCPLIPYYLLADGCLIFSEYDLLSYADAIKENDEFQEEIKKEELFDGSILGVVFAHCANGDLVFLQPDGSAARFSHESPEIIETWKSIAQFFIDNLE